MNMQALKDRATSNQALVHHISVTVKYVNAVIPIKCREISRQLSKIKRYMRISVLVASSPGILDVRIHVIHGK